MNSTLKYPVKMNSTLKYPVKMLLPTICGRTFNLDYSQMENENFLSSHC